MAPRRWSESLNSPDVALPRHPDARLQRARSGGGVAGAAAAHHLLHAYDVHDRCGELHAVDYLPKPVSRARLDKALSRARR